MSVVVGRFLSPIPVRQALRVRQNLQRSPEQPVNVYDAAGKLGFEVRFVDLPSFEGMYIKGQPPTIVISSMRPVPRQVFTCAHEIGHHVLGHGEIVDGLIENRNEDIKLNETERNADAFAAYFLMPPTAVDHAFAQRKIRIEQADAKSLYEIASFFQVGFRTLVRHLQMSLKKLPWSRVDELLRPPLRKIRSELVGFPCNNYLVLVTEHWAPDVPADCEVDDIVGAPKGTRVHGQVLQEVSTVRPGAAFRATNTGIETLELPSGTAVTVRVSRKGFTGRLVYRWEPEVAVD
jgi:Zn-dependent peptidase ImmA (M78 family)